MYIYLHLHQFLSLGGFLATRRLPATTTWHSRGGCLLGSGIPKKGLW